MKLLLLSDNHGNDKILDIINIEQADYVIHAGDSQFMNDDNLLKWFDYKVSGNCDFNGLLDEEKFVIENYSFFLTHGHKYCVKSNLEELLKASNDSDIIIYGHTHIADVQKLNNKLIINPGSTNYSRGQIKNSYVILHLEEDKVVVHLKLVATNQILKESEFQL